jgi:hypothetical protein
LVLGVRKEGDDRGLDGVELRLDAGRERAIFFDEESEWAVSQKCDEAGQVVLRED